MNADGTAWSSFLVAARSRAELDQDYAPSRFVASLPAVIGDWGSRTAAAKAEAGAHLREGLACGPHPRQRVDYYACDDKAAPLLVFLHGGFWQAVSKDESGFVAPAWRQAGVNVAVMDYALAPECTLPQIVAQVNQGLRWLLAQADALGFDPARVVLAGHSAGAHLAAMAWLDGAAPGLAGLALLSGVFELEPVRQSYVNDKVGMTAADAASLSPLRHHPAPLPILVAVGEHEPVAFQEQGRALFTAWGAAGCPAAWQLVPRRNHFDLLDDAGDPASVLGQGIARLLGPPHQPRAQC